MARASTPWLSEAAAIFLKDLRSELRTRVAVNSIVLFSVITLALVSYSIGPYRLPPAEKPAILSALLMILLFFASMTGLSRVFVKEEEARTADALRLAADPQAVFLGKLLLNLLTMAGVTAVVVPLFGILMEYHPVHLCSYYGITALGMLGLTVASTLIAAIISKTGNKGALFPILLPLLLATADALAKAAAWPDLAFLGQALGILVSYAGITFFAGLILFEKVWRA